MARRDWRDRIPERDGLNLLRLAEYPAGSGLITATNPKTKQEFVTGHAQIAPDSPIHGRMRDRMAQITKLDWERDALDNITRWSVFPHDSAAKIVFEMYEETGLEIILQFDYPAAREPLWAVAQTGWMALTLSKSKDDAFFMEMNNTHKDLARFLEQMDEINGYDQPSVEELNQGLKILKGLGSTDAELYEFGEMFRKSPAMAIAWGMMQREREQAAQDDVLSILHVKQPTWAGARGFNESYNVCKDRARMAKLAGGLRETDGLTQHHCMSGGMLYRSRVVIMDSAQILALADQSNQQELIDFGRITHLPFEQFFIDFTGDEKVPTVQTSVAKNHEAHIVGVLMYEWWEEQVLIVTPFFSYTGADEVAHGVVTLGSLMINKSEDPSLEFWHMGSKFAFEFGQKSMVSVAYTEFLDMDKRLAALYRDMIEIAGLVGLECLHFIEAANVEMVEAPLERRLRKKAEKRDWNIPMTVRIDRPNRRRKRTEEDDDRELVGMEYSHQFDVSGGWWHMTKGVTVACIVCKGKTNEAVPCSRCNDTGIDPEKVSACTRRDEKTGELTCPNGCRRIWHRDYVKGDPDKPYIPKARKVVTRKAES